MPRSQSRPEVSVRCPGSRHRGHGQRVRAPNLKNEQHLKAGRGGESPEEEEDGQRAKRNRRK